MHEPISSKRARASVETATAPDELDLPAQTRGQGRALAWHAGNLKAAARRRLPRPIFDYMEGGSYDEVTLAANLADLAALKLRQRVLANTPARNKATTIAGAPARIPVALAPIGFAGLVHPRGEIHAAKAAEAFGVPYCLSTFATCSMEEVAAETSAPFFFQLYLFKDRGVNATLLHRAEKAGCEVLVLTLDTCVQGRRNRDLDNGLIVPLKVRLKHVIEMGAKPRWTVNYLRSKRTLGNLAMFVRPGAELAEVSVWADRHFKGAVDASDVEWVRKQWRGKLVIKGVLDPEDARMAVKLGADAIVVSNHGGRQLDCAQTSASAFPAIRDEVGGEVELLFDSGVRSGLDVLKALGLGARGCFLGRAYLYGLAAHGQAGVAAALELIAQELHAGMSLAGVEDVTALPQGVVIGPARG